MAKISLIDEKSIFDTDCDYIVNTINTVGAMGKGIALEFRYRCPSLYDTYLELCKNQKIDVGSLFVWDTKKGEYMLVPENTKNRLERTKRDLIHAPDKGKPTGILNFPTKKDWKLPSRIEYIEAGIKTFSEHYRDLDIKRIAFPKLGATSGGLKWDEVSKVMYRYLEPLEDLYVEIYAYNPKIDDWVFRKLKNALKSAKTAQSLGLRSNQAKTLSDAINSGKCRSTAELIEWPRIGEKTLNKLYAYAANRSDNQKGLF